MIATDYMPRKCGMCRGDTDILLTAVVHRPEHSAACSSLCVKCFASWMAKHYGQSEEEKEKTARRRSEGAKSGWEIRRAKEAKLYAPERPWRVHGIEPGTRHCESRVERWCETHEEAMTYVEKFKAEGYVVTVEDRRCAKETER